MERDCYADCVVGAYFGCEKVAEIMLKSQDFSAGKTLKSAQEVVFVRAVFRLICGEIR